MEPTSPWASRSGKAEEGAGTVLKQWWRSVRQEGRVDSEGECSKKGALVSDAHVGPENEELDLASWETLVIMTGAAPVDLWRQKPDYKGSRESQRRWTRVIKYRLLLFLIHFLNYLFSYSWYSAIFYISFMSIAYWLNIYIVKAVIPLISLVPTWHCMRSDN